MTFSYLLGRPIVAEALSPCFFLFGEETYLAEEFVQQLKTVLLAEEKGGQIGYEKFDLAETRWADVIDVARTVPFLFTPRQLIVAKGQAEELSELPPLEKSILKDYFQSPSWRTILVVIIAGKVKKSHPIVSFFLKLPASSVWAKELKPLKDKEKKLFPWIEKKLEERGKKATREAMTRILEVVGNDLQRIANELEKVADFVADRKVIDVDDINQVCGWLRPVAKWELTEGLERRDAKQCLVVLNQLFQEGTKEEDVLGTVAGFFRDVLAAKLWLQGNKDKGEIFAKLRPFVEPKFSFYRSKFEEFFARVEEFSMDELAKTLADLEGIDLLFKTADIFKQARLEAFILDYCQKRRSRKSGAELTRRERG